MPAFTHVLAQEVSALRRRLVSGSSGGMRAAVMYVAVLVIFGIFLPWQRGTDFLDPVILGAYACLGIVFSAPAAAQGFEGGIPDIRAASARILVCVLYGELIAAVLLVTSVAVVYGTRWGRIFIVPDLVSLAECAILGFSVSLALTTGAVWASLRFSAGAAAGLIRLAFLALLIVFFFRARWLPDVAVAGAAVAMAAASGAFLLLAMSVKRLQPKRPQQ